jgi:pimeloyl-ACP methyl ester carboxylesterase
MKFISLLSFILLCSITSAQTDCKLVTPSGTIYGTLLTPAVDSAVPVVMLISGSGPTDRDGNNVQMKNDALKILADSLLSHGIASLRYDKRGIAASRDAGSSESDLRFDFYVEDAALWIKYLRKDKRFSKIIVAGHSEGSLIGMIAAKQQNADGFISLAGAGRAADELLKEQLSGLPESLYATSQSIVDSLKKGMTVSNIPKDLYMLFRPSVQPYMISWFKYNPAVELAKLQIPVLLIHGSTDIQVSIEDLDQLHQALPGAGVQILDRMNHILKEAGPMRQENISTYSDPTLPLHPRLVKEIIRFFESNQLL